MRNRTTMSGMAMVVELMMVMAFFSSGGPLSISSVTVAHMLTSLKRKGPQDRDGGMYSILGVKDTVRRRVDETDNNNSISSISHTYIYKINVTCKTCNV
jgi:hypothetical protein